MADGSIRINTTLETKNAAKSFRDLENMAKRAGKKLKNAMKGEDLQELEASLKKQQKVIQKAQRDIEKYQAQLDGINTSKAVTALESKIAAENKVITNAKNQLESYEQKLEQVDQKILDLKASAKAQVFQENDPEILKINPNLEGYETKKKLGSNPDYQEAIGQEKELLAKMREYEVQVDGAKGAVKKLQEQLRSVKTQQEAITNEKIASLSTTVQEAKERAAKLTSQLMRAKKKADMSKEAKKTSSGFRSAASGAKALGKQISDVAGRGLKKIIKMSMAVFGIQAAFSFARKAASEYLQSNEQLSNQIQGIWNTVAQAIGPVVQVVVGWITTLISYVNALIKAFTGIDFVVKGNAAALDKQADAAGNVANEAKKAKRELAGFDEMNILSKNDTSNSGSGGSSSSVPQLELNPVNVDAIKDRLLEFIEPIKNAWNKYGTEFVESLKAELNEAWGLIKSIGSSFKEVWLNGTGEETVSLLLQILTDIFDIVGNIAANFKKAWDEAGVGTQIIQNLWDLVNLLLGGVRGVSESIVQWSSEIDFAPLLSSLEQISEAVKPFVEMIGDNLKWLFDEVLLPLGSWAIEDALPASIDALSNAIDFLSKVCESASEAFKIIWDMFLQPIAEWTGGIIITVLEDLALAFEWLTEQEGLCEFIGALATVVGTATAAVLLFNAALHANPIMWVITIIVGLIAIIVECIKHWDDIKASVGDCWDWICEKWDGAVEFFQGLWDGICETFNGIKEWFQEKFQAAYDSICEIFGNVGEWFSEKFNAAWDGIKNAFASVKNFFSDIWNGICSVFGNVANWFKEKFGAAWEAVKRVFSAGGKVFDGIKDGILNGLKSVINALIDGINRVIKIPFDGINWALQKIHDISILGMHPFSWIGTIGVPQIPRLAKGGIVNHPGAGVNMGDYIAGERGPEAIVPLKDSSFIKMFAQEVASQISTDQPTTIILKLGEKEFYRWFINMKKKYDFVMNGG